MMQSYSVIRLALETDIFIFCCCENLFALVPQFEESMETTELYTNLTKHKDHYSSRTLFQNSLDLF